MLKQVLAAAGLVAFATGTALADGLPHRGSLKDAPVCCEAPNWNGFYVGLGVGYGHLVAENKYTEPGGISENWYGEGGRGGLGTVVLGFDRVIRDRIVAGLFVDFDWSSIDITYTNDTLTSEQKFRLQHSFSVGARAGYLITPATLLYGTAGWTWAHGKSDGYFDIFGGLPGKTSVDLNGYFLGVGMETMISNRVALRGEVRYTKFGDEVVNSDPGVYEDRFEPEVLTGRIVLSFKLHRDGTDVLHREPLK